MGKIHADEYQCSSQKKLSDKFLTTKTPIVLKKLCFRMATNKDC